LVDGFSIYNRDIHLDATLKTTTGEGHSALSERDRTVLRQLCHDRLRDLSDELQAIVDAKFPKEKRSAYTRPADD
jgi:hypothetical protein